MLKRIFVRGLITFTPIAITVVVVIWLFDFVENLFSKIYIYFFGPRFYFTGLGVLIAVLLIFFIGVFMSNWLTRKLYNFFERILERMPLIKTLYRSIVDLMSFFKQDNKNVQGPIVMVDFGGSKILGLVSRESFSDLPQGVGNEGEIAVYIPMSYQIGGVTIIVPRSMVHRVDMNIEEGLRFAATAGMPGEQKNKPREKADVEENKSK